MQSEVGSQGRGAGETPACLRFKLLCAEQTTERAAVTAGGLRLGGQRMQQRGSGAGPV